MIGKEKFVKLIKDYQEWSEKINKVCDVLGINVFEAEWIEYTSVLFDNTLHLIFEDEGVDFINWWLFERDGNPELKAWDENEKEIPLDTVEDLWEFVKDYEKSK